MKKGGCNEITCPRCGNIQCNLCSQPCDEEHFKDKCKALDEYKSDEDDVRHSMEAEKAEAEIRAELEGAEQLGP
jgi:DNA repair exonuclease SbcCD ATPase subunit